MQRILSHCNSIGQSGCSSGRWLVRECPKTVTSSRCGNVHMQTKDVSTSPTLSRRTRCCNRRLSVFGRRELEGLRSHWIVTKEGMRRLLLSPKKLLLCLTIFFREGYRFVPVTYTVIQSNRIFVSASLCVVESRARRRGSKAGDQEKRSKWVILSGGSGGGRPC